MAATINNFISALWSPALSFRTLGSMEVQRDDKGAVVVSRTTHFAQVQVEHSSRSYLLSLPLTSQGFVMAQRVAVVLRQLRSPLLLDYRILEGELLYADGRGVMAQCDLLISELPAGAVPLAEVIGSIEPGAIFGAIDQMEAEFTRLGLVHSNLKIDNIVSDDSLHLYPIRLHYASVGGDCREEFDTLRAEVCAALGCEPTAAMEARSTAAQRPLKNAQYGYLSVGNPFEGMCVAENDSGYGYIGTSGEEIIAPQFLWAGDMREGRAEVETATGMGLIDAAGNYIIEPHYHIVEFDSRTTHSRAKRQDGTWVTFDYQGREVK